ncbi:MAG: plastocyanin [Cyanobacteria bacterium P01_A01_bin.17]
MMSFLKSFVNRIAPVLFSMCLAIGVAASASPALASSVSVEMGQGGMLAYSPAEVTISPGDTVHFDVGLAAPHNVVFDPDNSAGDVSSLSHNALEMSGGFDVNFPADAATGEYTYYCEPHRGAGMVGKIVVQ